VATGKPRTAELNSPGGSPVAVAFAPDGKTFATATSAGLHQWQTATGHLLGGVGHPHEAGPPYAWSFSPDHRRFAIIVDRLVTTFNTDERGQVTGMGQRTVPTGMVWDLPATPLAGEQNGSPLPGSVERITLWLQAWTGREYRDEQGPFYNLPPDVWQERRRRLEELGGPTVP
jgi:hypothetical protein